MSRRIPSDLIEVIDTNRRDIVRLKAALSRAGGAATLDGLTDTTITAAADGDVLRHNGTAWVDAVLTEADISDLGSYALDSHNHDADYTAIAHHGGTLVADHPEATTSVRGFMSSADKTKLGNIETAATADQSAADIRTLGFFDITNDGATSGLDADKLDGQEGSYYAAASALPTLLSDLGYLSQRVSAFNVNIDGTGSQYFLTSLAIADPGSGQLRIDMTLTGHVQANGVADEGWVYISYSLDNGANWLEGARARCYVAVGAGSGEDAYSTIAVQYSIAPLSSAITTNVLVRAWTDLSITSIDLQDFTMTTQSYPTS
jgi:hypothetical protein